LTEWPSLLPDNATPFERTFEVATDPYPSLDETIWAMHGLKLNNPPTAFLPFLVWEYGLGELQPYIPNPSELISFGIPWQRVRGTPLAVDLALSWLGYQGEIEEAPIRRRFWNNFQIHLNRVRDNEDDLPRLDGVATLSVALRSDFWRGFHGYDARALEADESRWDDTMWEDDSGVVLPGGKAKWSFGRRIDYEHDINTDELDGLGIGDAWALTLDGEPLTLDGEPLRFVPNGSTGWGGPWLPLPWRSSEVYAASVAALIAAGAGPAWAVFKNADGEVLFYRRCRVRRRVLDAATGVYRVGASRFEPTTGAATRLYLEVLTDFGEGEGMDAASVGFILSANPAAGHKPGVAHLPPGALEPAGPIIAERSVSIAFSRTVREGVACLLRF